MLIPSDKGWVTMPRRYAPGLVLAVLLASTTVAPASAQEEKPTGLERARQASVQAIDHASGRAAEARGGELPPGLRDTDRVTGRARAAQAIAAAMERGNGNGYGRERSQQVLALLLSGKTPSVLEADSTHGSSVSAMVGAYNQLRKQERGTD
jgi:hypothetical protein